MVSKIRMMCAAEIIFALGALADDVKPSDEGKGAEFKSKKIEEKGEAAFLLSFEAIGTVD